MKKSNLKRSQFSWRASKLLLLTLFAVLAGGSPAWAQTIEDFESVTVENGSTSLSNDWCITDGGNYSKINNTSNSTPPTAVDYYLYNGTYAYGGSGNALGGYGNASGWMVIPVEASGKLSFYYRSWGTTNKTVTVKKATKEGDVYTLAATALTTVTGTTTWAQANVDLGSETTYVAFQIKGALIDNVTYSQLDKTKPWGLQVSNISSSSATLTWNNVGEETTWQVQYSDDSSFETNVTAKNETSKTCNLTELSDQTTYYVRVRVSDGEWCSAISFKATDEKETTVNDGASTNTYVPFYYSSLNTPSYGFGQFIIPATDLDGITNRRVTKLTFYTNNTRNLNGAEFDVYMQEYESQLTFTSLAFNDWETLKKVYGGILTINDNKMEITLDGDGFVYKGQNLLIGFKQSKAASSNPSTFSFIGTTGTGNNCVYSSWSASVSRGTYLPKVTFTTYPKVVVTGVTVSPTTLTLAATETSQLTATIAPANASDKSVTWSSDDEAVATVASDGTVTAIAAGTATITATSVDNNEITATCEVTVNAATGVTGVTINKTATTIYVGHSEQLEPTIAPDGATNKAVTWTSSDETVASVASDGTVTGVKAGTATITATSDDNNEATATCTVTVQNIAVTGMTLNESSLAMLAEETLTLVPTFEPSDATIKTVTWESSNTDVATVDENGVVTAVANGTATITATSTDNTSVKATCTINVVASETLTVNEGEATNQYVPVYGYYADNYQRVEFITPSTDLSDIDGGVIKKLTFYSTTESWDWGTAQFKVYIKEVENTTLSSFTFTDEDAVYYQGALSGTDSKMSITLTTPFIYNGKNLLIGIYETTKGTYNRIYFNGKEATSGASGYANASSSLPAITATINKQDFLPKTTFTYIPSDKPKMEVSDASIDFGLITTNSTSEDKQKTITISNKKGRATLSGISVSIKDGSDSQFTLSEGIATSVAAGEETTFTVTFTPGEKEDYTGTVVISATDQTPVEIDLSATYRNNPATATVKLDEEAIGETVAFGAVNKQAVKTFSITNSGDLPLTITSITSSNTDDFTVQNVPATVAGGATKTFDVTFVFGETPIYDVEKTATITIKNSAGEDVTFSVTGTRIELWEENFSGSSLPDGWEDSANAWTFAGNGEAVGSYNNGNYLYTPSLTVEDGKTLTFEAKKSNGFVDLIVYYSKDNGTYTQYTGLADLTTEYQTYTISGLAAGNYKFRINDEAVYLRNFSGFKLNANDPTLFVSSDAAGNTEVASGTAKDFGWASTAQTATYYIKNTGTGTLTINSISNVDGFTATTTNDAMTVANDADPLALTITMNVANEGAKNGTFTITTDGGTFTIPVSGYVVGSKNLIDFTANEATIPTGWKRGNWSVTNGVAISTSASTMETRSFTVAAGENLLVDIKGSSTYETKSFAYSYSTDNGTNWSDANTLLEASGYGIINDQVLTITDIADAEAERTVLIRFIGQNLGIKHIYGFTAVIEPIMTTTAADIAFGMQTAESTEQTFTISNEGNATLEGLSVTLGKTGEDAEYSIALYDGEDAFAGTELATGKTITVKVKQLFDIDNTGSKSDVLTIAATGQEPVAINLSGATRDGSKLYVTFDNEFPMPSGWQLGTNWNVNNYGKYLYHTNSSNSAFRTTPLTVVEGEKMTFKAKKYGSGNATLAIRYSDNGGITWNDATFTPVITSASKYDENELTSIPAGTVVLEFVGNNVQIDDIYGFAEANAPMIEFATSEEMNNDNKYDFGQALQEAPANKVFTLTNRGTANLVSTVVATGDVTFALASENGELSNENKTVTLEAGESATITVSLNFNAEEIGEKTGTITITSNAPVAAKTFDFIARVIDASTLNEELASLPEGWYNNGWTVDGTAHIYTGVDKTLITELYGAETNKNVLSFDAKVQSGNDDTELKVYTSSDRKTWSDATIFTLKKDPQNFKLDALADGNYYVKFESLNASIDNLSGLKKLTAPEHDLYASATTFPTTTLIPETENGVTASATVYSLRADETGVYAKLFFDEAEIATADAQDISKDASKTFNFTANVPATEKTYAAKIVVYYSDNSVAWETTTANVVVSHTRTLQITDFARTSDATADANGDNQFTSTFNVTVKNTGTVNYNAANVSVSITDAEGNVIGENTTTWNLANSQTVFINPGEYTNDGAVLAIWRYNTDSDGEWGLFTKINDNLYSAERNGKTNFNIVRLKKEGDDGYNSENGGLNWDNKYNQSTDMKNTDGNFFTFKGWDDKDGENNHWFTYGTMSELPINASTTFAVSLTTSALEGGLFTFKAKENMSNTVSTASATVTVNAAAPKFALYQDATPVNDGDDVQFGIVKGDTKDFTFTIRNEGNKMMEKPEMAVPTGFEASYVPADGDVSEWMLFFYKDGTVDADQGSFKATATENKYILENVNVPASGINFAVHKKNGNDWTDIYGYSDEGGWLDATAKATKLATATNASGWMTIAAGNYDFIWNATDLTLMAKPAGAILAGESQDVNVTLKAEQGKVNGDLVFTYKVDGSTNNTFTLALSGRSVAASTWIEEFTTEIPASWTNNGWTWNSDRKAAYSSYTAGKTLMTPRLAAENGEELTFDLYFPYSGYQMKVQYSTDKTNWTEVATYTSTSNEQTIEGSFTAPAAGNYYLLLGDNNSNSKYAYVDNFVGFQLNIPEHDMEIAASAVPTTGKQYNTYTATVSLKENAGKDEAITAKLFVNGADVSADVDVAQAGKNATTVVTLTWEPQSVIDEAVKAYVKVTYDGGELTTEEVDITVAEVYTLDEETSASTIEAVTDETVLLKRTFAEGWNTVCLPFAINDVETFFGIGTKAYQFTSYTDGTLNFATVATLDASYPYIVYVPAAITEAKKLSNITISSTTNEGWHVTSNEATFQGTYAPIAAPDMEGLWGVTNAAKIAKGTDQASMKGFRAYFVLPEDANARLSFFDETTGIRTVYSEQLIMNSSVYNMNGQKVERAKKGLYIINGKKQVIK